MTGHSRKIERHSTARHQVSLALAQCLAGPKRPTIPGTAPTASRACESGFPCLAGREHA